MARSPYQGTFQPNARQTVVTAPDALVYINGELEVVGCPSCTRTFDLNKYITSIQVDLNIDSPPGSASLSLSVPRHTIDDFYFDGNPVITPMMEIEIYAKGYYLLEGVPQYYPIFWGLVTEVSDNYSGGEHTVSISAADITKWWELSKMNINPALTVPVGQLGRSIQGNVLFGTNPYDVIWTLAQQSFGDVVLGTGSLESNFQEARQASTFAASFSDMMLYWQQRFSKIRSNLVLYGTSGVSVRGDTLDQIYSRTPKGDKRKSVVSSTIRNANGGPDGGQMVFDPADENVVAFKTQFSQVGQINFWQSEYQTKLELANAAKEAIGFEFYMDVTGEIVFKPPFYNLDIMSNKPVSWIQDIDIIDWNMSESEAEVVTQIVMQGSFASGNTDFGFGEEVTPFTSVVDYHLLRKYGWRSQNYNSEFLGDTQLMFYHGLDILDRINSKRHRASVTIPFRPELRMGFPIYLAPKDQIWYIQGISHNISFGGRATTTLTLTAKRSKFIAPKGTGSLSLTGFKDNTGKVSKTGAPTSFKYTSRQLSNGGSFKLKIGNAATLPATPDVFNNSVGADNPFDPLILRHPKTGKIVGYPNAVMVYTRPFAPSDPNDIRKVAGIKDPGSNPNTSKSLQDKQRKIGAQQVDNIRRFEVTDADVLREKHLTNRYQYGLNSAGVYMYAHDSTDPNGVIGEVLTLPSANISLDPPGTSNDKVFSSKTALIRPVSDERGFEVIGHYRYGRRVALRDGQLILTNNVNTTANVDVQLALGGGLFETLNAQAQGLTAITSAYSNPADAVARLTPEDTQTAGVLDTSTPDMKQPKFTNSTFVDTATLGSPEQKGLPATVEASQFSRALTLAEMTVKEQTIQNEDCPCITGRADLAFMNIGYQVKTLSPSASDNSGLFNQTTTFDTSQPIQVGQEQQIQQNIQILQSQIEGIQTQLDQIQNADSSVPNSVERNAQKVSDLENKEQELQDRLDAANQSLASLQGQRSNNGSAFPTGQQLISKVETFLANLYKALDAPHQKLENVLRGGSLPGQNSPDQNVDFPGPSPSEFAPPFSAPNRFQLGDPKATVGAIESNTANLAKSWSDLSQNLKGNADRTLLTQQISRDKADISRLTAQLNQVKQEQASNAHVVGVDLKERVDSLTKQISDLEQRVSNEQTKLAQLPQGGNS